MTWCNVQEEEASLRLQLEAAKKLQAETSDKLAATQAQLAATSSELATTKARRAASFSCSLSVQSVLKLRLELFAPPTGVRCWQYVSGCAMGAACWTSGVRCTQSNSRQLCCCVHASFQAVPVVASFLYENL